MACDDDGGGVLLPHDRFALMQSAVDFVPVLEGLLKATRSELAACRSAAEAAEAAYFRKNAHHALAIPHLRSRVDELRSALAASRQEVEALRRRVQTLESSLSDVLRDVDAAHQECKDTKRSLNAAWKDAEDAHQEAATLSERVERDRRVGEAMLAHADARAARARRLVVALRMRSRRATRRVVLLGVWVRRAVSAEKRVASATLCMAATQRLNKTVSEEATSFRDTQTKLSDALATQTQRVAALRAVLRARTSLISKISSDCEGVMWTRSEWFRMQVLQNGGMISHATEAAKSALELCTGPAADLLDVVVDTLHAFQNEYCASAKRSMAESERTQFENSLTYAVDVVPVLHNVVASDDSALVSAIASGDASRIASEFKFLRDAVSATLPEAWKGAMSIATLLKDVGIV